MRPSFSALSLSGALGKHKIIRLLGTRFGSSVPGPCQLPHTQRSNWDGIIWAYAIDKSCDILMLRLWSDAACLCKHIEDWNEVLITGKYFRNQFSTCQYGERLGRFPHWLRWWTNVFRLEDRQWCHKSRERSEAVQLFYGHSECDWRSDSRRILIRDDFTQLSGT